MEFNGFGINIFQIFPQPFRAGNRYVKHRRHNNTAVENIGFPKDIWKPLIWKPIDTFYTAVCGSLP